MKLWEARSAKQDVVIKILWRRLQTHKQIMKLSPLWEKRQLTLVGEKNNARYTYSQEAPKVKETLKLNLFDWIAFQRLIN